MSQSTTGETSSTTTDATDTRDTNYSYARDIQGYQAPDIHGRHGSDIGAPYSKIYPSIRLSRGNPYVYPVSEMPLRRIDDASLTRSDLLEMDARGFELLFGIVWMKYAEGDSKKESRLSAHSDLDPDNEYCGVHAPSNPDRGLDLIVRDDPSYNQDIYFPAPRYDLFQLKKYDDTQVSAPEVQSFIGTCMTFNGCLTNIEAIIKKAYFVTTSTFSQPALNAIQDFNRNSDLFDIHPIADLNTTVLFRRVRRNTRPTRLMHGEENEVINPQLMPYSW